MVLDEDVLSRDAPAPSNGLDNLDVLDEAIGDIESSKMRTKSLCWDVNRGSCVRRNKIRTRMPLSHHC